MDLAAVMDTIAARVRTIPNLRVFGHPADNVHPPAALVTYPGDLMYDATFERGADTIELPVVVLVGRVDARSSRDLIAAYAAGSGPRSIKAAIEAHQSVGGEVAKLDKFTMAAEAGHSTTIAVVGQYLQATLATGTDLGTSNLRDVYVHEDVIAEDFHCWATFDPPFYGGAGNVFPQHGIVMRYQRDTKQRAVAVWQNITFFGIPLLFVGVWQANLDGTGFTNRQNTGFPPPVGTNFPHHVEAILRGNICQARVWQVGTPVPSWDDPDKARTVNLDTDAGDPGPVPTPVGAGQVGVAANHLSADDEPTLSAARYPLSTLRLTEYAPFDTVRVRGVEFDIVGIGAVEYLAATFTCEIAGHGA